MTLQYNYRTGVITATTFVGAVTGAATGLSTTLVETSGGTGTATYTTGDILYADGSNSLGKLAASTDGYVLTATGAGSAPAWEAATGGIGGSITDNQIAVGATTADDIEGSSGLTWAASLMTVTGDITLGSTNPTLTLTDAGEIHFRDEVGSSEGIRFNVPSSVASNPELHMTSTALNPQLHLKDGAWFRIYDGTNADYVNFIHNGTNLLTTFSGTTDWNIAGNVVLDGPVTTADQGTGAQIKDGLDNLQPVGFNTIPVYEIDAADTFDLAHVGMMWHKDSGGAISFTVNSDAAIPVGASYLVHNDDTEDLTIAEGTATIEFLAAGAAPVGGDVTVEQGGIVTVYKYTDAIFWVWGSKEAAGGGTTPTDITVTATGTSASYRVPFLDTVTNITGDYGLQHDNAGNFYYNPSTNTLVTGTFSGALSGNATTATSATTATTATIASTVTTVDESVDTTAYILMANATVGNQAVKTGTNLAFNTATGALSPTSIGGVAIGNLVDKSAVEQIAGVWQWTVQPQMDFGIGGGYSDDASGSFGATMWSIDESWKGSTSGTNSASTDVYGTRWLRATHTEAHASVGEGMYIYTAGVNRSGIGQVGIQTDGLINATGNITGSFFYPGNQATRYIDDVAASYGSVMAVGAKNGYWGFSCGTAGDIVLMSNGSSHGLYDDVNNDWWITCAENAGVSLYQDGGIELRTQQHEAATNTSGAELYDHSGTLRDAGFNHVKEVSMTTSNITLSNLHAGTIIRRTASSAVILTMAAAGEFPIGSMCTVLNHGTGGSLTISDGSEAMYIMDGSGSITDSLGFVLPIGGCITIWRQGTSAFYVWGAGVP